ncbi:MAG: desulfoferrodoxin [Paludibacteraceae bacterium]|jgi:superoxide reductase|nr:desulfoferrodoxin [Paludibacteraceae bacterium]MBR6310956.1 desulfoferrodoxin [Paludibacteraceae bacterium]
MATKFYVCKHCGNVAVKMVDSGVVPSCCGEEMTELKANTVEASAEKHLPVVTRLDVCTINVKIGSEPHPMLPEHHIAFVFVETERGGQWINLAVGKKPEAVICVCKEKPIAVYEYCNIHGLWKTELHM